MADYTISSDFDLPDGVLATTGTLTIRIYGGHTVEEDGTIRIDPQTVDTDEAGLLTKVLPEGWYSFTFRSAGGERLSATHHLTADTTWGAIFEAPTVPPLTPSLVEQATTARDEAVAAQEAAETAQAGAEAVGAIADTQIAGRIDDPASATRTALNTAIGGQIEADVPLIAAPLVTARPAPKVIVIGCSIENLFSYRQTLPTTSSESYGDKDWPTYAMLLSGGRFQLVRNMGNGGESTTDYLARFDTDVVPSLLPSANDRANTVVIGGLENDIQESTPLSVSKANIIEMVERTRSHGAVPVLRTTMPHSLSNAIRQKIGAANHWIRNYGAEHGIVVMDFWRAVVDPATGQYQAAYTSDGVHASIAGAKVLGQLAVDTLCATIPVTSLNLAADPTDAGQLAPTPLFTTDTSGTPTLWNAIGGSPAGVTRSMVTDPLVPGRMARIANVASSASVSLQSSSSRMDADDASPGDVLEVSGVLTSDGGVTASVTCAISYNDGTAKTLSRVPVSLVKNTLTRASYRVRMPPLPAGFQAFQITLASGAGTGVVDFGYPTVRNLTREGLL